MPWRKPCNHWIVDSTPVPCGMSRPTIRRSDLAGWAGYGYCASHSRFFWGLRLYLVCTPTGMPIVWAPANPKIGEREVLASMLETDADLVTEREGILLISDKGFAGKVFEQDLAGQGVELPRPSRKREKVRYGEPMLSRGPPAHRIRQRLPQRPARPGTTGRPDLRGRRHPGRPAHPRDDRCDLAQPQTSAPVTRSLIAYDH